MRSDPDRQAGRPDAYDPLAVVYDWLQQDVNTAAWAEYVQKIDRRFNQRPHGGDGRNGRPILVDLGCGTGDLCREMAKRGYDPIGIDRSVAMLEQARRKNTAQCLFIQQDISRFELYGTADLIVCLLDTLNHLVRPGQAARLIRLCANYLNPGGILIFDVASQAHLSKTLGRHCFYQDTDEYTLLWQNSYRPASGISRSELLIFSRQETGDYRKFETTIIERYFSARQIRGWILAAGLECLPRSGRADLKPPSGQHVRQFYVARRPLLPESRS